MAEIIGSAMFSKGQCFATTFGVQPALPQLFWSGMFQLIFKQISFSHKIRIKSPLR